MLTPYIQKSIVAFAVLGCLPIAVMTGCATNTVYVPQPTHTGRDIGITLAVVGGGVGLTLLAVHEHHFIKGCTVAAPGGGIALQTGDAQVFTLVGSAAGIKEGELIRVKGKKGKKDAAGGRSFLVDSVSKDYGVCRIPGVRS